MHVHTTLMDFLLLLFTYYNINYLDKYVLNKQKDFFKNPIYYEI